MSPEILRNATGCSIANAATYAPLLSFAMDSYQINTPKRQAAFLAQLSHESLRLSLTREIWGPTEAQKGYEGRSDLGNFRPGDGERFMGRGLIQITGRANYIGVAGALCLDCVNHPELLEQPEHASDSAAWWWKARGLNQLADDDRFSDITRRINGGLNGEAEREALWKQAKEALGVP